MILHCLVENVVGISKIIMVDVVVLPEDGMWAERKMHDSSN
jgi:hypothetical protein